ncbi:hypothetical protein LINGRAHAP2_LOCUS7137 [Linum grandiflorum]
MHRTRKRTI